MHYDGDPIEGGEDIEVEVIPKGLKVVVPEEMEAREGAHPVLQIAYDYIRAIKVMNETIAVNTLILNQKIIKKITKKR